GHCHLFSPMVPAATGESGEKHREETSVQRQRSRLHFLQCKAVDKFRRLRSNGFFASIQTWPPERIPISPCPNGSKPIPLAHGSGEKLYTCELCRKGQATEGMIDR